jgi:hypothetical protein
MQDTNYSLSNINLKTVKMKKRNKPLPFFIIALLLAISQQTRAISLDAGDSPAYDYGLAPYIPMATLSDFKPVYKLFVWTKDGEKNGYLFADKPEITIEGNIFTVTSARTTMGYRAADIEKFTLEDASVTAEDMSFADVNGDGVVDVADIATIISVMAQGDKIEEQVIAADVNGDGVVDVADIAAIISVMAGK